MAKNLLNGLLWAWSAGIILAGALYIIIPVLLLIAGMNAETETFCSTNLAVTGWACIAFGFWGIDKAQKSF